MSVTFAASANSTPASGTVIATCVVDSEHYQLMVLAGQDGNTLGTGIASPLLTRLADGVDSVAVTAASRLMTDASVIGGSVALLAGANTIGTACVIQGSPAAIGNAWPVTLTDGTDTAVVNAASRLLVEASLIGASVALLAGANTIGAASAIQSGTWALSASVVNAASVVVTNGVSASISGGSVALLAGAATIGVASVIQSGAWAVTASLDNSPSVVVSSGSVVVTNALSASISGGSVALLAGAATIGAASVIQGTAAAITAPWPVKVSDGTDSAIVDAASRLAVAVTDGTNAYGLPASPLSVTGEATKIWWGGSLLTLNQINLSTSAAGSAVIIASAAGQSTVIVAATFTTSSCQTVGWIASGNGASTTIQTAMPFGTNGGMDANRLPHGYLWQFPSGSHAAIVPSTACNLAGTLNYLRVAS